MRFSTVYKKLEIGDLLFDIDGKDRMGLGVGIVKDKKSSYLSVKFSCKTFPIFVNNCLFCYDRAGKKGSIRCYSYQEVLELQKDVKISGSTAEEYLLELGLK